MAQLVAHLLCKQGVTGSSPVGSTISDVREHLTSVEAGVGARAAKCAAHSWSGDTDPATSATDAGPPQAAQLHRGERIVVDEAGMLDQDTALALFIVAAETSASLAPTAKDQPAKFGSRPIR